MLLQDTKREAAKDEAARKASELRARQRAMQASGQSAMTGIGGGGGYGSSDMGMGIGGMWHVTMHADTAVYTVYLYSVVHIKGSM
jgi:hypothetical protein